MLSMIFTFVFCFNLEKTPQNIEFRPKITCCTVQSKTKIPVNTPMGYVTGIPPLFMIVPMAIVANWKNDQCKILKISSRSKSASLNEELSTPFDFASQ